MFLSVDQKYYIMVLVVTLLLAYFLGITIAGIVDYRLKDAVINLPKPRNNVYVHLDPERDWRYPNYYRTRSYDRPHNRPNNTSSTTNINVSPTITNTATSTNTSATTTTSSENTPSSTTPTTETFRSKSNKKDKKVSKKHKTDIEPFSPAPYSSSETNITNLNRDVFKIDPFYYKENKNVYKDEIVDPNVNAYSLAYDVSKKMTEYSQNNFPFIPSNLEDLGDQYTMYKIDKLKENKNRVVRPAKNIRTTDDLETEFKISSKYEELPLREKRCPTFKAQRPWTNSVNKHNVIVA
jgi:hypothetical protein